MAIEFNKTAYPGFISPFWRKEVKVLPGGFNMKQTNFANGDVIMRGAFLHVDFSDMSAAIVKIGKVVDGGTATKPRVSKNNNFAVGDVVAKVGADSNSATTTTVVSIDRSNAEYDVVEIAASLTLATGDFIVEADSTSKEQKYVANAVLAADLEIKGHGIMTIDASYDCIMIKSICAPFPADWLIEDGYGLKANPNILIINQ